MSRRQVPAAPGRRHGLASRAAPREGRQLCRRYGRTQDVDCVSGAQPCLTLAGNLGFAVDEAEVVFWGVCPACKAAESSAGGVQRDEEVWQ